jgi:hypothetical protein
MKLRLIALVSVVAALALYRILPHPMNFTPVMALALFAGAKFDDRRTAFLVPLLAMLLSDLVIGFHETMLFVYGGMALAVALGLIIRRRGRSGGPRRFSRFFCHYQFRSLVVQSRTLQPGWVGAGCRVYRRHSVLPEQSVVRYVVYRAVVRRLGFC